MAQKIRVFTLAKEFNLDNDAMVAKIQSMGVAVTNYMSGLDPEVAQRVRRQVQKEKAENTVEDRIRPTVVRRRTRAGAPAASAAPAAPARKRAPKGAAVKETPSEPAAEAAPDAAVLDAVALESEPSPAPRSRAIALEAEPADAEKPAADIEALKAPEEPATAADVSAMVEVGGKEAAAFGSPTGPDLREPSELRERRPVGIEVASGPAQLRPSNQAPVVRRRISPVVREASRPAARPFPQRGAAEVGVPPAGEVPWMEDTGAAPAPDGDEERQGARRGGRVAQRRRELESRDITPSGRFSGIAPGRFGAVPPGRKRRMAPGKKGKKTEITTPKAIKRVIRIDDQISLHELAKRMGVKATELLMQLMGMGVGTLNINSTIDSDTAKIVASDFGYDVENVALDEQDLLSSTRADETEEEKKLRELRPPDITMMGHVDHGKTSLLDKLRKSNVAAGEAGGITQHIGAYRVKTAGGTLSFIDTPGHAAFTAMRARGAELTDIVILVVAADDGVMAQTVEAISHARAAGVPIMVAINKCDLPTADPGRVKRMLMEHSLVPEELGGETIMVPVSAKTGEGLDKLVEMMALQAEVMELTANPQKPARGVVLEAYLDRGRGPVANLLVQDGTLQTGEVLVAGAAFGKIRAMSDEHGRKIKEAGPSTPVEVLGLDSVPSAGDQFDVAADMKVAEKVAKSRVEKSRASAGPASKPSLETLHEMMQASEKADLKIIIKSDVQGTMEALRESLEKLSGEKVKVTIVHASVGGITESDVLLASTAGAIIIGFNVRPAGKARKVAEEQGVDIRLFSIIYDVIDAVKSAMVGMLAPVVTQEILGQVEVRDTFSIPKVGTVAGSYVTEGKVVRNARARLFRDSVQIWEGKVGSLRRFKDDVKEVQSGFECGISLDGYNDVKVRDVIEIYVEKETEATLS